MNKKQYHTWKSKIPFLKLRTWIVMRGWEVSAYVRLALSGRNTCSDPRILIFGQGRSGTTLFEDLLCATGYVQGYGEVLHHHTREVIFPVWFIMGLARFQRDRGVIVHVKGSQLTSTRTRPLDRRDFLQKMVADGWTVVHVVRENTFDQVKSEFMAKARGGYHKTDDAPEVMDFSVSPDLFLTYFRNIEAYKADDAEAIADIPHVTIVYERDLADPATHQATVNRVLDRLRLPRRRVQTKLKRIGGGARNPLKNYDEIIDALRAAEAHSTSAELKCRTQTSPTSDTEPN